jgi:ribonuclease PH
MPKPRHDGRRSGELRPLTITTGFVRTAAGSCLIELGGTRVICTACFASGVPPWLEGKGRGWLTAEYGMLPASTSQRKSRPLLKPDSRGVEIQRLIGRALRNCVSLTNLGEHTLTIDCDVLEADGGTRTAAITGAYVALAMAQDRLLSRGDVARSFITGQVAAVSAGIVDGAAMLDLDYSEDSRADVDMNVAMMGRRIVELQVTAERAAFDDRQLQSLLKLTRAGISRLMRAQRNAIADARGATKNARYTRTS